MRKTKSRKQNKAKKGAFIECLFYYYFFIDLQREIVRQLNLFI